MSNYYTLLTNIGAAEFVNASAANASVPFTHLGIGDGNGAEVLPVETMVGLVREVHRAPINSITPDPVNPNTLIIEAVVPSSVGGWVGREISLIGGMGAGGKTLAIGNMAPVTKPLLEEGSARDIIFRMYLQVSNASIVKLTVDPAVALATNQSITNAITVHVNAVNPHPQYAKIADLTAHQGAQDAHPQYAKLADLAQHALAADPHSQYITADELATALSAVAPNMAEVFFRSTL